MLAVLCPGQGAQKPGMTLPWMEADGAPELLVSMSRACGLDLASLGSEADEETLRDTALAQPVIVAASLLSALAAGLLPSTCAGESAPDTPDHAPHTRGKAELVVAGHSLGFLTALAVCGALAPEQTVCLAAARGEAMARCARSSEAGMVALVGGGKDAALASIEAAGLVAANVNGSTQVVASGPREALARLQAPPGARLVPLAVAGAFHSPLMAPAVPAVTAATGLLDPLPLTAPLIDDTDGVLHPAGQDSGSLLSRVADKVTAPVRWDLVQARLSTLGVQEGVELAPAGALTALSRRDLLGLSVRRLRSLQDAADDNPS